MMRSEYETTPLVEVEIRAISMMDGGVSIHTVRRLLATIYALQDKNADLRAENSDLQYQVQTGRNNYK